MGPPSLPAECSLLTSLHNFGKKKSTYRPRWRFDFKYIFQILWLCRWILISYMIINVPGWTQGSPRSSHMDAAVKGVWSWPIKLLNKHRASGEVPIWPPQSVALNCGYPSKWHYTQCSPAVAVMFSWLQILFPLNEASAFNVILIIVFVMFMQMNCKFLSMFRRNNHP